ncbi:hypothetical protein [Allobranchiibius huperziae]|uniref:SH3b domain-containing protein n=1 Tax=Allobranchiibius huperziae TaxID=1874116 RepID=A0A853DIR2_9MICO|nr:hypothetical protein [Allobranchiibius huperziae]NYJ74075.1 hypothetical protein [Allobranchiibius huperziae]
MKKALTLVLATGALATLPLSVPIAQAHAATASYSCSIDSYGAVQTADWLKVHRSPSTSSGTVGQVKRGTLFHYCSSSGRSGGGHYWVYGYGYNGSKKLTGWVASEYLAHP